MTKFFIRLPAVPSAPPLRLRGGEWSPRVPWVPWEARGSGLCRAQLYTRPGCRSASATLGMGLRLPLRRSTSFTPDHPALMEVPGPAALKMEANVLVMGADNVGKSGENWNKDENCSNVRGTSDREQPVEQIGEMGLSPWGGTVEIQGEEAGHNLVASQGVTVKGIFH